MKGILFWERSHVWYLTFTYYCIWRIVKDLLCLFSVPCDSQSNETEPKLFQFCHSWNKDILREIPHLKHYNWVTTMYNNFSPISSVGLQIGISKQAQAKKENVISILLQWEQRKGLGQCYSCLLIIGHTCSNCFSKEN